MTNNYVQNADGTVSITIKLKWFWFDQNNSGGHYTNDENQSELVFVQAANAKEAVAYIWDKLDHGYCECCGERWSNWLDDGDGSDFPAIYGTEHIYDYYYNPFETYAGHTSKRWRIGQVATLHFYDGHIEKYTIGDKPIERIHEYVTEA